MSAWPGKYVIGLTGNIATGKSVVRRMLEHLGAYGIDADALAHRAIAQDAPGYQPIVDTFGKWVLGSDGQVDRSRLSRVIFADPEALARLEAIVHPLVGQAVDILIRRSPRSVVVLEAIKLIESGLNKQCDSLWVTYASQEMQMSRLMQKRGMTEAAARQRIQAQPVQEQKTAAARVVIQNTGSFEDSWRQVVTAWQATVPGSFAQPETPAKTARKGELAVERARPRQAGEIAELITRLSKGKRRLNRDDIMAAFGDKAFLVLRTDGRPVGVVGWKVENLVARTDGLYLEDGIPFAEALRVFMQEVEQTSRELQCEASLLFLPDDLVYQDTVLKSLGYQQSSVQSLGVRAWQEAAIESRSAHSVMLFKQLRQDRVLRPV
ncbi:MAG TPA: dephospho-CoA kinase [Anaerolineales bacterium]